MLCRLMQKYENVCVLRDIAVTSRGMHVWEAAMVGSVSQRDRRCLAVCKVSPAAGDVVLESAESKRRGSIDAPRIGRRTVRGFSSACLDSDAFLSVRRTATSCIYNDTATFLGFFILIE